MVKLCGEIVTGTIVVAFRLPEVPVSVRLYSPRAAVLLAFNVSVLEPVAVGFGEKEAVTPLGRPEMEKVTLPVKPFWGLTEIYEVPELPWPRLRLS